MTIGLLSYTNRTSGIGLLATDSIKWLGVDSMLSVWSVKGQEHWLPNQVTCRTPDNDSLIRYLDTYKPDALLGFETMFREAVYYECRKRGIKTILVIMHESYRPELPIDLLVCPTQAAYNKVVEPNKVYFPWPIDIDSFPIDNTARETPKYLHICGHGMRNNRRQTDVVIAGFLMADIPTTLTVRCQRDWRKVYGDVVSPKIRFELANLPDPRDLYVGHDVLVQPDAYAGYNRVLYEAQAVGLDVITTDAPPMDECETDWLIVPSKEVYLSPKPSLSCAEAGRTFNTTAYIVSPESVADAVTKTYAKSTSRQAMRARAEKRAWTTEKAQKFLELLKMWR